MSLDAADFARVSLLVQDELKLAAASHGPMVSHHEAYALILEELDEYWDLVRLRADTRPKGLCRAELVQVAAMAIRAILDLEKP